jgi:transcriptional regulator with GAF, ATPase, and Fis domain
LLVYRRPDRPADRIGRSLIDILATRAGEVLHHDRSALRLLREQGEEEVREAGAGRPRLRPGLAEDVPGFMGVSAARAEAVSRCVRAAPTDLHVLFLGETGTGKELFALAIHQNSPRAGKAFKVLNCAAVSETLLESELFGHVKGAFTGAIVDRKGLIQAADGGTLFLDEIGDMPLPMQAKLLRTLDTGEVLRVGTNDTQYFDVRFVAATNHDLSELVRTGAFREDLFYRLHAQAAIRRAVLETSLTFDAMWYGFDRFLES